MVARNRNIVRAHQQMEFTHEDVQELVRCANDPVYFIRKYVVIQHPIRGAIPFDLYPYQEAMINDFLENRFNIVLSARQTGKALCINTDIPTPTGFKKMGDIVVGDYVLGDDGNPTKVIATSDIMVNHDCYRVKFSTGEEIIADKDHLWNVTDEYTRKPKTLTTHQMVSKKIVNQKNQARFSINTTEPLQLPSQNLLIDPYLLGVWLGDGSRSGGSFTIHEDDSEIIDYIKQQGYEVSIGRYIKNKPYILSVSVYGLQTLLKKLGVFKNKHIPQQYLRGSYEQRLQLLQGLMDTDGHTSIKSNSEIGLSNKILSDDVKELICSLGLKTSTKIVKTSHADSYRLNFTAYRNEIEIFKLKRKVNNQKINPSPTRLLSTKKRSIQSITLVNSTSVKCISVNNANKIYLVGRSMIPTHNSQTSAAFLMWYAMFKKDKTLLILSNKNDNAMEMINRIQFMYEHVPNFLKPGVVDDGWNKHSVGFDNGSRIISQATTEMSGRGLAISLIFCDEFAFVRPGIQDAFWTSIKPTLATGGACIIASTPNGDTNLFAQLWRGAEVKANQFFSRWVKWDEPPNRDEEFKQREIAAIGIDKWRQEYECEFLSSDALLFDSHALVNLTPTVSLPTPNERGLYVWEPFKPGKTYIMGIDPATGSGNDFSSIEIFEFPSLLQVMEFRSNTTSSAHLYLVVKYVLQQAQKTKSQVYFSVENNGVGEGIIALYQADETIPEVGEFVSEPGRNRIGFNTTGKSKLKACLNFKNLIERNKLIISSKQLLNEMKNYIRKSGSYEANYGSTDDCVSAVLIVMRILEEISTFEQEAYDRLYSIDDYDFFGDNDSEYDETDVGLPMSLGMPASNDIPQQGQGTFTDLTDPDSFDPWGGIG